MKLLIAEKPSVANEIARIIGVNKKGNGYLMGNDYYISWCFGHLVQPANPDEYINKDKDNTRWDIDQLPIIPDTWTMVIDQDKKKQFQVLSTLMNQSDVSEIICATDAGREGELIFRHVYYKSKCKKPFKRLWISSLEEKSVRDGLNNMLPGNEYDDLYKAALCRQKADWLIGMNFTRLYTAMYKTKLTTGRVQTPTLNFIVERQREINNFTPKPYFSLRADLGNINAYKKVEIKDEAEKIVKKCTGQKAIAVEVERKEKKENPYALYDLTLLSREANRLFGYTAMETMNAMQQLYESKLTSYHRTESQYITKDMENSTENLITSLLNNKIISNIKYDAETIKVSNIVNDSKVTDHHGIIPTMALTYEAYEKQSSICKNLLIMIIFRLLASVYTQHQYVSVSAKFDISGEIFTANGKKIEQAGFKTIEMQMMAMLKTNMEEETQEEPELEIIDIKQNDAFIAEKISVEEKETRPPSLFTENTLLQMMQTAGKDIDSKELKSIMKGKGIGTNATRAAVIEQIIKTGYVERKGRKLIPTVKAFTYIDIVTDKVKEPDMTAEFELQLDKISQGQLKDSKFMDDVADYVKTVIAEEKKVYNPQEKNEIFMTAYNTDREVIGKCPVCGKNIFENTKAYGCEGYKDKSCNFVIWKKISGKGVSKPQAKKILANRKSDLLKGFVSKDGKSYNAYLILKDDNSIGFSFDKK